MLSIFSCISVYHIQNLEYDWLAINNENKLFEKYSILFKDFFDNLSWFSQVSKIKLWRVPFCIVPEEYRFMVWETPDIYNKRGWEYKEEMIYKEWVYSKKCSKCKYYNNCDKFFDFYIEKFWDLEIKPIY